MINYEYIDKSIVVKDFKPEHIHELNNIIKEAPYGYTTLKITESYIEEFIVPDDITCLYIESVGLKQLELSVELEKLYCKNNYLTTLHIYPNLWILNAPNNNITHLTFNCIYFIALFYVNLQSNNLKRLDFPIDSNIQEFNINDNPSIEYISPEIEKFLLTNQLHT